MTQLLVGIVLFFGIHSVAIVAPAWRDAQAARLKLAWRGLYAVVAIVGLVLLIQGFGLARHEPVVLYSPAPWMRHVTMLLMLPVFPLLIAAYAPGRIKAATKHPMLAATKFWAFAHLLSNGTLGDVLLFGAFLMWAVADRISLSKRPARAIPGAPPGPANDVIAAVGGLGLYALFVWKAHAWVTGRPILG